MFCYRYLLPLFLSALAACSLPSWAQTRYYTGAINEKLPIQMELSFENATLFGEYRYESVWQSITLHGGIDEKGAARIVEKDDDGNPTGTFTGAFTADRTGCSGTWKSPDSKRSYQFKLQEVAEYKPIVQKVGKSVLIGSFPLFQPAMPQADKLNHILRANVLSALQRYKAMQDTGKVYSYNYDIDISFYNGDVVSLLIEEFASEEGAAHPSTDYRSIIYRLDPEGPLQVTLSGLFDEKTNFREPLFTIVMEGLSRERKARGIDNDDWEVKPENLNVYTISPKAITFIFPQYVAGSYAEGEYAITINYDGLRDYIYLPGPLQRFLK